MEIKQQLLLHIITLLTLPAAVVGRRVWVEYEHGQHDVCLQAMTSMSRSTGLTMHYDFTDSDTMVVSASEEEIRKISENPAVKNVVEDVPRYPMHIPDSFQVRYLQGQQTPYGIRLTQADQAHAVGVTGSGVRVCVIDSGLDRNHEDFVQSSIEGFGGDWGTDGVGHGTHCAGTIAAADNGIGVLGVAPDAELFIVKVFGDDGSFVYSSGLVDAANRCRDAGATIISMSLGGPLPNPFEFFGFSQLFNDGILSVAAAGNDGSTQLSYPAGYDGVLGVGAVDSSKNIAPFSQRNSRVDISAPGVDVLSTFPMNGCQICSDIGATAYGTISGTSMATPHVAGVAALLWSLKPDATVEDIVNALQSTADDVNNDGRDDVYGHGIVQAFDALESLNGAPLSPVATFSPTALPTAAPFCDDGLLVEVEVKTDKYGNETFWSLSQSNTGFTVLAGANLDSNTEYSELHCLPSNCYIFEIVDAANDGYEITVNGAVVGSGGAFSGSEQVSFGQCSDDGIPVKPDPSSPSAAPIPTTSVPTPVPSQISTPVGTEDCIDLDIFITTDRFPGEISLTISLDGESIYSLDGSTLSVNTEYVLSDCVEANGCYEVVFEDSFGDGLCCTYGNGSFEVVTDGQTVLSSSREFTRESVFFGNKCNN